MSKKSVQFVLMTVGANGLGKASLINTLFDQAIIPKRASPSYTADSVLEAYIPIQFTPYKIEREEYGQKLAITVIDTHHFGESLNNTQGVEDIKSYIEAQYQSFLEEEARIKRNPKFEDTRVHVLLYFIAPSLSTNPAKNALRDLDILFLKTLAPLVSIIPVLAKSDSMTASEKSTFKQKVMQEIKRENIAIYDFASLTEEEASTAEDVLQYVPFSIVSAQENTLGSDKRGRQLHHGFVECDNPSHSDTKKLRDVLFNLYIEELRDATLGNLYESYRTQVLSKSAVQGSELAS